MMRARSLFEAQTAQNVCLFCLHRLQSRTRPTTTTRILQRRPITSSRLLSAPPGIGAAPAKKWGKFGGTTTVEDFPVPFAAPPTPPPRAPPPPPAPAPVPRTAPVFEPRIERQNAHPQQADNEGSGFRIRKHEAKKGDPDSLARFEARRAQQQDRRNAGRTQENPGWGRHLRPRETQTQGSEEPQEQNHPSERRLDLRSRNEDGHTSARTHERQPSFKIRRHEVYTENAITEEPSQHERRWRQREEDPSTKYISFGASRNTRLDKDRGLDVAAEQAIDADTRVPKERYEPTREVSRGRDNLITRVNYDPPAGEADAEILYREQARNKYRSRNVDVDDEVDSPKVNHLRRPRPVRAQEDDEETDRRAFSKPRRGGYDDAVDDDGGAPRRPKRYNADAQPRSYDATPQRRGRQDTDTRRASKFADPYEEEVEDPELVARRERKRQRQLAKERAAKKAAEVQPIELPPFISVQNLATALHVRLPEFVSKLEELGFEEIANDHVLNFENASLIASEYNYEALEDRSEVEDLKARPIPTDFTIFPPRPPIVTIMGHVDHGKTTLLDYLRKSSVAATEHGGITQHIGAFSVQMASGKLVTFLDTPGHAAFLSMRQRGANVTDIVILVVAADDSVKPQTIEAIKHARAAQVPIIVAINKIDKDEADPERVKQDLLRNEIEVEDFGGDVQAIPVSGKTGQGLDELEEAMTALAETIDMRADRDGAAEGWILEATTKLSGRVATVLVRRGTLRPGDVIVAGTTWSRVRTLKNEAGIEVSEAGPGTPVEVDGWRDQPSAGDEVIQAPTEQKATSVVRFREERIDRAQAAKDMDAINENRRIESEKREREKAEKEAAEKAAKNNGSAEEKNKNVTAGPKEDNAPAVVAQPKPEARTDLYFIIKADVSGSAEAVDNSIALIPLSNQPVSIHMLRSAVGPVSESDIDHAAAVPDGNGVIVNFNQAIPAPIAQQAERAGVKILDENIIYKVIDKVRELVEDKLPLLVSKRVIGEAEAAAVFEINTGGRKFVKIIGCRVRNGAVKKGGRVRVYRGGVGDEANVVYDGTINSLKSQKKDVPEMRKGTECGMSFENWEDFKVGDVIQCYEEKSEKRRLM